MFKIAHIISGDLWAGAEVMACHLLKGLHSHDFIDLSVILLNPGRLAQELRSAGVQTHIIDESHQSFTQIAFEIRSHFAAHPPEAIHAHRYKENLLALLASIARPNTRLITTQHGLPENHHRRMSIVDRLKSNLNVGVLRHSFGQIVGVSEDIRTFFVKELRFPAKIVTVVHNGIDIPDAIASPAGEPFIVGSSGRLFPVKGYPLLVEIARELKEEKVHFALAGEGPERGNLQSAIEQHGVESFSLRGHLEDMSDFYRGLSVYINTSFHEGIPMTILEAMAQGLPVIAPKVGGIPEIYTDGVEGFLIEGRDPRAFAEKIRLLHGDPELRQRMSAAARKRAVEAFSVERMVDQYVQIYEAVMGKAVTRNA